jgi:hypothetical protein
VKIRRTFESIVAAGRMNAEDVKLRWDDAVAVDKSFLSQPSDAVPEEEVVQAMVHRITPEMVQRRGYVLLAAGDVIVDFPVAVTLVGRRGLFFEIDGVAYVQKRSGDELLDWPDTIVDGSRIWRTIAMARMQRAVA